MKSINVMKTINTFIVGLCFILPLQTFAFGQALPNFFKKKPQVTEPTPIPPPVTENPTPTPPAQNPPVTTNPSDFQALWSRVSKPHVQSQEWTRIVQDTIVLYGEELLKGSEDMQNFCPQFDRLGTNDRINFWVELIAAMTRYESGFKPTTRYTETTMGTDPITGSQVVSEGLLQLSYQDIRPYPFCDFDFEADRQYALDDIRRSILDPARNLACGTRILNNQIKRRGLIAVSSGAYWAVIKTNSKYNKLEEIKAITNALSFCQ